VQDVVSRIRFDAGLDAARFVVGYEERGAGIRETPLPAFVAGGDVPWHRVQYVKAGPLTVWDRQSRVDLIFGSGETPAADLATLTAAPAPVAEPRPARRERPSGFGPSECLGFDAAAGQWRPVTAQPPGVDADAVQVATFNVLSDAYDRELTYPELRVPACVELLEGLGADVVALHEVTHALWAALLAAPWVRAGYHVSAAPEPEIGYSTTMLSRWPLTMEVQRLSSYKRLLLGRAVLNGQSVGFVAAHLTSDHTEGAEQRRQHQLRAVEDRLGRGDLDAAVVLADLNVSDATTPSVEGFTDAWRALHPHDAGFTFDPAINPLAAVASRTGRAARLDRILVRGGLRPVVVERFADRPFATGRFVSDHFGVTALLQQAQRIVQAPAVHTSALVASVPEPAWEEIQKIRAVHDPSFRRWMPHVNLVYGFVPEECFPAAAQAVAEAVQDVGAIRVRLARFERFEHRGSTTVWLDPETSPPDALRRLQSALAARFPGCVEQDSRGGFTPHLTVAKLTGSPPRIAEQIAAWQRSWTPVEFTVGAVDLISRRGGEPFAVRASAGLVTGHRAALALVTAACEAAGPGSQVHVVGSVRLGVATADTDLDVVWATPPGPALGDLLPLLPGSRLAGTVVPVLRCTLAGISVDVQHVTLPAADRFEAAPHDDAGRRAVLAVRDADALLSGLDPAAFRALLRQVRAWSAAAQLDGAAWGLVGGFSWAVLVAEALRHNVHDLAGFLRHCAGHPRRPRAGERHAYWPVYSPTPPGVNTTRTMTRSTALLVQSALRGPLPAAAHERTVGLAPEEGLDGRVLGLILALEEAGARVRPYPRSLTLGLDGGDPALLAPLLETP